MTCHPQPDAKQRALPPGRHRGQMEALRSKAAPEGTARWLELRKSQAAIQEGIDSNDQQEENQQDSERKPLRFLA